MLNHFENPVRLAVRRAGGPTRVAGLLGVSGSCVHYWVKIRNVPKYDQAEKLAKLANMQLNQLRQL